MIHTAEFPNNPRPAWPASAVPRSAIGSARSGGGNRRARSADTEVTSSSSSIRCSAAVSDCATGGDSGVGMAMAGDRYSGCRSVIRDRPQGPTLLRVIRYTT